MIDRGVVMLLAGCVVLGVVIAVELTGEGAGAPSELAARPADRTAAAPRAQGPRVEESQATILGRPLFSASRKPPASDAGAQSATPDLNDVRLTGIVVEPERRLAIFAMPGAKALLRGEGETVNDWRLEAITPQQVTLSGPTGTRTLQPKVDGSLARRPPPPLRPVQNAPPPAAPGAALPKPASARPAAPAAVPPPVRPVIAPRERQ